MNIYFLVEGRRTEKKVYPKWLSFLIPELCRVDAFDEINENNYYIFSGNGFPSLLDNHLRNCVEEVNQINKYQYLVICLDSDGRSVDMCRKEVIEFMQNENIILNTETKLEIIVQDRCLETWFLGNRKIFKKNAKSSSLQEYMTFYNVKENDPELMNKPEDFDATISIFHWTYLHEFLAERNINYTKKNPNGVIEKYYLEELIKRYKITKDLASFGYFIDFCQIVRKNILE